MSDRDVEKVYSNAEFAAKLRRLADAVETGKRFDIQIAGCSSRRALSTRRARAQRAAGLLRQFGFVSAVST